jgi:hypothetical protein
MNQMDISYDSESDNFSSMNSGYSENNLFSQKNLNFYDYNPEKDYLFNNNLGDRVDVHFNSVDEDFVECNQRKGNLFTNELSNIKDNLYIPLFTNAINSSSNTNKEANLAELCDKKQKTKAIFEVKKEEISEIPEVIKDIKELPPKYFSDNSINDIIKQFNIRGEMQFELLLNTNIENNDIKKIKSVLESDKIKRVKKNSYISYRSDSILSKIINLINLSLLNFINKLIRSLYSKEEIKKILEQLNLLKKISEKDLKEVIKNNDYEFRYELTKKDEKLKLLNWTLKDYFSTNISSKFKYPINYNKLVIEKILEEKTNKDIFEFILNDLLIIDWLEIFLYKKDLSELKKFNLLNDDKKDKIEKNLERIDKYINDKYINKYFKNDKNYYHCFILIIYNLKRYLINKEARNRNKKEKKEEIEENEE